MTAQRPSSKATATHQRLLEVADRSDQPLAAVLREVSNAHQPRAGRSINSLACDLHNPNTHREWFDTAVYDSCPDCVVTTFDICSCGACDDYPCKTLRSVLEALGIRTDPLVNALPAPDPT